MDYCDTIAQLDAEYHNRTQHLEGNLNASRNENRGRICSVEGCGADCWCRGYCAKHYQQWRKGQI